MVLDSDFLMSEQVSDLCPFTGPCAQILSPSFVGRLRRAAHLARTGTTWLIASHSPCWPGSCSHAPHDLSPRSESREPNHPTLAAAKGSKSKPGLLLPLRACGAHLSDAAPDLLPPCRAEAAAASPARTVAPCQTWSFEAGLSLK